jgi:hypothetical protein
MNGHGAVFIVAAVVDYDDATLEFVGQRNCGAEVTSHIIILDFRPLQRAV